MLFSKLSYTNFRSSDSTKYGTNKSSGASVTSGKTKMNNSTYGAHDSVSNGKPPMHPNHHHNHHNHRTTTSIPVHNSNIRLINNTVFHNNQNTIGLNRYDDSGYLESTGPLSIASLYGDSQRISRGTKSDIGAPIFRPSKKHLNSTSNVPYNLHKDDLPPVKSDFLLSYLNNNSIECIRRSRSKNLVRTNQDEICSFNNNSESHGCELKSAYHISGVSTCDFSETYKTDTKYFHSNTNTNTSTDFPLNSVVSAEHIDRRNTNLPPTTNEQQPRIINFVYHSNDSSSVDTKNNMSFASGSNEKYKETPVVGPLLYKDPTSESPSNTSIMTANTNHSLLKSVSNKIVVPNPSTINTDSSNINLRYKKSKQCIMYGDRAKPK